MGNHFNSKSLHNLQYILFACLPLLLHTPLHAQNYYGIQGSNYAGSLSAGNNPASIVNVPYKWDVTILGLQEKNATNGVTIHNYSLLSSPQKATVTFDQGDYRRFAYADFNINLLNTRIALNRKQVIGFGMNLRGYAQLSTGPINFVDSLKNSNGFFNTGNYTRKLSGNLLHSSWVELYATWGQTIWDNNNTRLNAGITAKVSRGISAAYTDIQNGIVGQTVHGNSYVYVMQDVLAQYAYSDNYDGWQKQKSTSQNLRDFVSNTRGGASLDLGVEYIIKPSQVTSFLEDDTYYDYDWKIGLSLLDVGLNQYKFGRESRLVSGFQNNITDSLLDQRFTHINNLHAFNDSLAGIARNIQQPGGLFNIVNPARMVLNVDHFLFDAFYINGNLSVNLSSLSGHQWRLTELNLLTITPRWETHKMGVYLPVQFNTKNQLWVGGAFKYGPLLLGVHNWAEVFAKNKMQNGGVYLALTIHAWKNTRAKGDKRLDCPHVGIKYKKNPLGSKLSCPRS